MKHLKSYQIFENSGPNRNELYRDLIDILYSEIFDDFAIVAKTDETFSDDHDLTAKNKFWVFRFQGLSNTAYDTSDFESIKDKIIDQILIFNITQSERNDFWESLMQLQDRVKNQLNQQLIIGEESVGGDEMIYDYILKLKNIPGQYKKGIQNIPVEEDVKTWLDIIKDKYVIKSGKLGDIVVNFIEIAEYKTLFLSGHLFNKGKLTQDIYNDMANDLLYKKMIKLQDKNKVDASLRKAIEIWIDNNETN